MLRVPLHVFTSRRATPPLLRRAALLGGLLAVAALVPAASAPALTGTPINIGTPFSEEPPAVAMDSAGNAIVAWANTHGTGGATDYVQSCVLLVGATACLHSVNLMPADSAAHVDRVQVLVDGSTVVILADVYGAAGAHSKEYAPEQEWQSTDGGATFATVDGGKSVANGTLDKTSSPLNAVILPGTNVLGYGWDTPLSPPSFSAFPLSAPPQCSEEVGCPFAKLEPSSNPDQLGNEEGAFAAQSGAAPGVLGVFETLFTAGPLGCAASFGTGYVYGSGAQSSSNNYNIEPGLGNSAWRVPLTQASCDTEYPAVGGGPSGFGVLEDNLANNTTVYQRFDQGTERFDTPPVTVAGEGELDPAVSQDGAGGVYATLLLGGGGGPISLAYSYNGGTTWVGPATLNANTDGHAGEVTSSVNAAGQGWAVWVDNGSVYAQSFTAQDAVAPPAPTAVTTNQTSGTTTGASITIPAGTVGETDKATVTGANAGSATGTMSYRLYSKPGCEPASQVVDGGTVPVTAGVAAASAPVTPALTPGTYYWQASYSGNPGSVTGAKGNQPSTSACGSEVLTVGSPPPSSEFKVEAIVTSSEGTITITIVVTQPGEATFTVTISTSTLAHSAAVDAKSKRCKHGEIKLKHKCVPATTVVGKTAAKATAGGPLKLTVHLSNKIKSLLKKGKTVHLTGTLTFQSALGGKPATHTYSLTVKGRKGHKGKHKK